MTLLSLFDNQYGITEDGKVWSVRRGRFLKPIKTRAGYLRVCLCVDGRRKYISIHRLVAQAFIPNPENKPTVNHINEDKTDNRAENLEWATHHEQNVHGTRIERAVRNTDWKKRSEKMNYKEIASKHDYENINVAQMKAVRQMSLDGEEIRIYRSIGEAAREMGISTAHIWECCNGRRKTSKGSRWEYA